MKKFFRKIRAFLSEFRELRGVLFVFRTESGQYLCRNKQGEWYLHGSLECTELFICQRFTMLAVKQAKVLNTAPAFLSEILFVEYVHGAISDQRFDQLNNLGHQYYQKYGPKPKPKPKPAPDGNVATSAFDMSQDEIDSILNNVNEDFSVFQKPGAQTPPREN